LLVTVHVVAAVDLHQLAQTRPPMPRLVGAAAALRPGHPEPGGDHPRAQRFHLELDDVR
jgi:hypothetical protein